MSRGCAPDTGGEELVRYVAIMHHSIRFACALPSSCSAHVVVASLFAGESVSRAASRGSKTSSVARAQVTRACFRAHVPPCD